MPNDLPIMISAYSMIPDAANMAGQPLTVADFTTNIPVCDGMACKRALYHTRSSPRDIRVRNRIIDHVRAKGGEGRVYTGNGWRAKGKTSKKIQ